MSHNGLVRSNTSAGQAVGRFWEDSGGTYPPLCPEVPHDERGWTGSRVAYRGATKAQCRSSPELTKTFASAPRNKYSILRVA